jgi:LPS sulfotransferase NodH
LTAAGLGVPHEYFNSNYAERLMTRWGLTDHPLSDIGLGSYIELLRRRRAAGGIFSTKLQYGHFNASLRNRHGAALFEGACVVHLFRPDIAGQLASLRAASQTGQWDYSGRQTTQPENDFSIEGVLSQIEALVGDDAGFRRLFALLGIHPLFVTMEELFNDPRLVINSIACKLGAKIKRGALERMIRSSSPYSHPTCGLNDIAGFRESLKRRAFLPEDVKPEQFSYDGQILSFAGDGNGSKYLLSGWSKAEGWGVWSDGPVATVVLADAALASKGNVQLVIEARGFVTLSQPTQRVQVRVNGADVGELWLGWDIRSGSLQVPAEALTSSLLQIDLVPQTPISPEKTGTSSDKRLLGVGLKSLQLRELA